MSSSNMNNLTPLPGARRTADRAYDARSFNNSDPHAVPVFYRSRSTHTTDNRSSGVQEPRRLREVRNPAGVYSIPNSHAEPHSRLVHIHRGDTGRGYNPRIREIFWQSSPRTAFQTSEEAPQPVENSRSAALSKLKKEVYNPTPKSLASPKRPASRVSSHNRDNHAVNGSEEREKENDEEGKRCAICLEDFKPKEEVMLTPCKHMFHEHCIVPWLTSNGQCPVCRFVISERLRENPSFFISTNNIATLEPIGVIASELFTILRAMEEPFQFGNGIH